MFTPGQDQLKRGARWVRCDVIARSGDQLIALPAEEPLLGQGRARAVADLPRARLVSTSRARRPYALRVVAVYQASARPTRFACYTAVARHAAASCSAPSAALAAAQRGWRPVTGSSAACAALCRRYCASRARLARGRRTGRSRQCIAIAAAAEALIDRVEPNWAIENVPSQA